MSREMKDSGVKWIGMIPKEWKVVRVKNKYSCNKLIAGRESEKYVQRESWAWISVVNVM